MGEEGGGSVGGGREGGGTGGGGRGRGGKVEASRKPVNSICRDKKLTIETIVAVSIVSFLAIVIRQRKRK